MSLAQLADVELQLVMHGLDCKELLQLARCDHRLMHAADSSFAWTYAASPLVDLPPIAPILSSLQSSRLLRHTPLSMRLRSRASSSYLSDELWLDLDRLSAGSSSSSGGSGSSGGSRSCRMIHTVDSNRFVLSAASWKRLLTLPCTQALRVVRCGLLSIPTSLMGPGGDGGPPMMSLMRCLLALPNLHTLHFEMAWHDPSAELGLLSFMPSLTSLSFKPSSRIASDEALWKFIKDCPHLRQLRVDDLLGQLFRSLFTAPNLLSLESLTLKHFSCLDSRGVTTLATPADFIAVFSSLVRLRSLELIECGPLSSILAHAHLAPSLRFVTIQPPTAFWPLSDDPASQGQERSFLPSPTFVAELLTRCAALTTLPCKRM